MRREGFGVRIQVTDVSKQVKGPVRKKVSQNTLIEIDLDIFSRFF